MEEKEFSSKVDAATRYFNYKESSAGTLGAVICDHQRDARCRRQVRVGLKIRIKNKLMQDEGRGRRQ